MANELSAINLFLILAAGVIPPLVWLWFWLKEDSKRPEPRKLLIISFFFGALSVIVVLPFQSVASALFSSGLSLLFIWAAIEELAKYFVAFAIDLRKKTYDEPIDAIIYLITVALGFAAFENVLFLLKSSAEGGLHISILTASMRFVGATLLHIFSSAAIGGALALGYCKSRFEKIMYLIVGVILASALHTMFNFFIINEVIAEGESNIMTVFALLWTGIIGLLLFFEKVKNIKCYV